MLKGRGWHGERKRHSDAARKRPKVAPLPVQVMDTDVVELVKVLRFLKGRRKDMMAPEDKMLLEMLNDRILLKEEQLKAALSKEQVELVSLNKYWEFSYV